jgi:hypothetical protein
MSKLSYAPILVTRFNDKVEKTSSCWVWKNAKDKDGYGIFWDQTKIIKAHRFSYQLFKDKIPQGLQINHLCKNTSCVNPNHLEVVSCRENLMKGDTIAKQNAEKTHCKRGHEFNNKNTRFFKNERYCLPCHQELQRQYYISRKLKRGV